MRGFGGVKPNKMNRQILFRGLTASNEWVEGDLMWHKRFTEIKPYIKPLQTGTMEWLEVKPESIGQFTNLHDKHGKRIFEGDLLHRHMNVYWYVKFKDSKWIADEMKPISGLYLDASQFIECEIVGSIHTNPELLQP